MKYENASILMVVQEDETNIFDQRLISQKVFKQLREDDSKTLEKSMKTAD